MPKRSNSKSASMTFPVDDRRLVADERCSLCGALIESVQQESQDSGDVADFVRWFAHLEETDFIGSLIILLLVRNPTANYTEIANYLTKRFGTIHGITRRVVSTKAEAMVKANIALRSLVQRKKTMDPNIAQKHTKPRCRASYGSADDTDD